MTGQLRTSTEYDLPHLEELQRVVCRVIDRSAVRRHRTNSLLLCGCGLAMAYIALARGWFPAVSALCAAVGVFFAVRFLFAYRFMAKTALRQMDKSAARCDYALEKARITVYSASGSTQYPYGKCSALLEAERCLYVILEDGQGLALDKANVTGGTPEDLRAFLEGKTGRTARWVGKSSRR